MILFLIFGLYQHYQYILIKVTVVFKSFNNYFKKYHVVKHLKTIREKKKKYLLDKYQYIHLFRYWSKTMKATYIIAFIFVCTFCETTSLKCYYCSHKRSDPSCDSPKETECPEEYKFSGKIEYDWLASIFFADPPGHYLGKGCVSEGWCTESGYYWWWGYWMTCCQGDYCNE